MIQMVMRFYVNRQKSSHLIHINIMHARVWAQCNKSILSRGTINFFLIQHLFFFCTLMLYAWFFSFAWNLWQMHERMMLNNIKLTTFQLKTYNYIQSIMNVVRLPQPFILKFKALKYFLAICGHFSSSKK